VRTSRKPSVVQFASFSLAGGVSLCAPPAYSWSITGTVLGNNVVMRLYDCGSHSGFTGGCLSDEATALMLYVHNCTLSNAKADTVVAEFGNNTTGVMRDCFINGRHTTIASNITTGTGMAFYETYVVEEAAKNALLMPAVDAE